MGPTCAVRQPESTGLERQPSQVVVSDAAVLVVVVPPPYLGKKGSQGGFLS